MSTFSAINKFLQNERCIHYHVHNIRYQVHDPFIKPKLRHFQPNNGRVHECILNGRVPHFLSPSHQHKQSVRPRLRECMLYQDLNQELWAITSGLLK